MCVDDMLDTEESETRGIFDGLQAVRKFLMSLYGTTFLVVNHICRILWFPARMQALYVGDPHQTIST